MEALQPAGGIIEVRGNARPEWAIHWGFEINHYQTLLFIVDSLDHLFSLVGCLEQSRPANPRWMKPI
jgi:hypothetical protein